MKKPLLFLLFLILSIEGNVLAQDFRFHDQEDGVLLTYGDKKIYFYQSETKSHEGKYPRANYIHPLYDLSGEVLTEDFPEDHLHHRGIFWAWHQLYIENEKTGDPWECRGISWEVQDIEHHVEQNKATLTVDLYWMSRLGGNPSGHSGKLLKETTTVTCRRYAEDHLEFEFDISLKALKKGTKLGGSEDKKGYGGFSARIKLPEDLTFYSINGKVTPRETAVREGGWITMKGSFAPEKEQQTAITMMCNPDRPDPFHGWILRSTGSMQNAAFPGRYPVSIDQGETLSMRYKLILHPSEWGSEKINSIYDKFLSTF